MPPKARITKDMIIDAAFELLKTDGIEIVNARKIAEKLNCSTQPIMYYFSGMNELKSIIYKKADAYHTAFIMDFGYDESNPLLEIGIRYIRFAVMEKAIFKFLFQSDKFADKELLEIIRDEELRPVLEILSQAIRLSPGQAEALFEQIFFIVHGIASLLANNQMTFDEAHILNLLKVGFKGAVLTLKAGEEKNDKYI